ncbi:MAG: PEGA domain-containing protein [Planctomycetota bacterium]|jgi:hypothetical protein
MARCVGVLLLLLAVARTALPADTGMLYVKSDPPGATVVIGGVERGKTPVLVKGLPAGETKIELRIEGAKPVVVRETIEANKVARVSAEIDVPGASLTIISDPLEATVYLDKREHGKTPITIEGLQPGEHALLLLKAGSPRTARTIILAAGEERVLEVKLGTAQPEEETRPPPERTAAPTSRVPEAMREFFGKFVALIEKGDHAGAERYAKRASAEKHLAEFKTHVLAAAEAGKLLGGLEEAAKRGAELLVGKEAELATKTGTRVGRVKAVDDECITLMKEIKVGRQVVGGTRSRVAWRDLTPEALEKLAKDWPPEGTTGAVAQALAARARGDVRGAQRALNDAGDDLLGQYLREGVAATAEAAATAEVTAALAGIERRIAKSGASFTSARRLLSDVADFKRRHAKDGLPASLVERITTAERRARRGIVKAAGVPDEALEFGGHLYMLYDVQVSWPRAKALCERMHGHLVSVTTHEEHEFLLSLCRNKARNVWLGFTDSRREGSWMWVTGEKLTYTRWRPGEPNNWGGNEDYGVLEARVSDSPDKSGMWIDADSKKPRFFVCEWDFAAGTE